MNKKKANKKTKLSLVVCTVEEETKIGTEISFDSPILKKRNKQSSVVK